MKLSAISHLLHKIFESFGYVEIEDGGDLYRIVYNTENSKFVSYSDAKEEDTFVLPNMYQAMQKALEITRSVEECEITCGPMIGGQWFQCSHFGLAPDEEIIDSYITPFAESVNEEHESWTAEKSMHVAMEFMRHGEAGDDWYDLWNEGSFKEAAESWPEASLSANYFADSLMFCKEE